MGKESAKMAKKRAQCERLYNLLGKYSQVVQVSLANVTSAQFKQIHKEVRERKGQLIVLKNSLFRKACEFRIGGPDSVKHERYDWAKPFVTEKADESFKPLLGILKYQYGYIFTDEPIFELKPRVEGLTVPAAAKVGQDAQTDVVIPPGPSGMDPSQIGFFHALQITTKIVKGQIEIQKEYKVCTKGDKVTHSAVQLMKCMNIRPFSYGMKVNAVFDSGEILDAETCSISPDDIIKQFQSGVQNVTALSLETGIATELSVPHSIINAFKSVASIGVEIGYEFDFLKSLQSAASSAPAPAQTSGKEEKKEAPKKEEKVEEEEEDVDLGGGGLFGDDDDY